MYNVHAKTIFRHCETELLWQHFPEKHCHIKQTQKTEKKKYLKRFETSTSATDKQSIQGESENRFVYSWAEFSKKKKKKKSCFNFASKQFFLQ